MSDNTTPGSRSFSGTHAYRPACVSSAAQLAAVTDFGYDPLDETALSNIGNHWAAEITERIENGKCPRCKGPLPEPPEFPAGSRITACRCIPVCGKCGTDEWLYPMPLWRWPTSRSAMSRRRNKLNAEHPPRVAIMDGERVIDETGSHVLKGRPNPGGWAEFGLDDEGQPQGT